MCCNCRDSARSRDSAACGAADMPGAATLSSGKLLLADRKMEYLGFVGLGWGFFIL